MKLRNLLQSRLRLVAALFMSLLGTAVPGFSQTFLAEWTAAASGGVGPTGLALATEAGVTYLYVADHPRGRILKFNTATGALAGTLGTPGSGNGQFNAPYGLAVDPASGDLYVAERGNHRVQRITNSGTFVMAWGAAGTAPGQFGEPVGVAVDAAGDVYVTEHANHRVQKFRVTQTAGAWSAANLALWGSQGAGNNQFNAPYGIATDASGNVWVADGLNGRVQRFNSSGAYQSTVGSAGTAAGQFLVVTGVSVDAAGALYVTSTNTDPQNAALADSANQWVSKFSASGTFVSRFGGAYGSATGQFRLPFQAVVGANNRAYVSDYYNGRVQVFDLAGTSTPPPSGGGGADTTAPTVATFTIASSTATSVTYQVTFSESVTGVNSADFETAVTGGVVATIGTVSGSGAIYTVPVTFTGTSGTLALKLKATGTGIADASANAFTAGATGPTHTLGTTTPPPTSGTTIASVTVPASGTYEKGDTLTFTLRFSGNVTVRGGDDDDDEAEAEEDDDDARPYFTWTAAAVAATSTSASAGSTTGASATSTSSGKVVYVSGSGTSTLTFRYKVKNGDVAPAGIRLGTTVVLPAGAAILDVAGAPLATAALAITWPQNPLTGVILAAAKTNHGKGKEDRLVNLSSRLRVTGGDASRAVIAGFVVTGSAPKLILIRAVGPGLASFGIRDALAAPRLELRDSTGKLLAGNDGWGNNAEIDAVAVRVGAFKLARGSRDAAILLALAPGAYTAQITANGNGVALLEVYDASSGTELDVEQIVNISTRGFVETGDEGTLVAGFVVAGKAPKRVLIRGVGPSLSSFGLTATLADPQIKLHASGTATAIAQNDNWGTPQAGNAAYPPATAAEITAATTAAGAFPLQAGSKDAAIVVTLPPGNYSAVMSGSAGGTGPGLVEVYEIPSP